MYPGVKIISFPKFQNEIIKTVLVQQIEHNKSLGYTGLLFLPQPLRLVRILFSSMVS